MGKSGQTSNFTGGELGTNQGVERGKRIRTGPMLGYYYAYPTRLFPERRVMRKAPRVPRDHPVFRGSPAVQKEKESAAAGRRGTKTVHFRQRGPGKTSRAVVGHEKKRARTACQHGKGGGRGKRAEKKGGKRAKSGTA